MTPHATTAPAAPSIAATAPVRRPPERPDRAAVFARYGPPSAVALRPVEPPPCGPEEVLLAVRAAGVNPLDWHRLTGTPFPVRLGEGLLRPRSSRLGLDVAGVVEAVGSEVTRLAVGDPVFGTAAGSFADRLVAPAATLVAKPEEVSFEQAAAVPVAALTALQGLRDHGRIEAGQRVLIHGASGGVGTFAVQLARHFGATVTAVCSGRNVELVRGLGAERVVDYTVDDFTADREAYDLLLDNIGDRRIAELKRCLAPEGRYVVVGGPKNRILGPLGHMVKALVGFAVGSRSAVAFIAQETRSDLELLGELLAQGAVRPVLDTVYPLDDVVAALRHLETGRARGKIVVTP